MADTAVPGTSGEDHPEPRFSNGQCVRHLKTAGVYVILSGPAKVRFESDGQPAYAYQAVGKTGVPEGPIWVRAQTLMEDGRFAPEDGVQVHWRGSQGHLFMTHEQEGVEVGFGLRFVARVVSMSADGVRGSGPLQCVPSSTIEWDCTDFVMAKYTGAERSELVLDPDSFLADTLRQDPAAPKELASWTGSCKLRVYTR